MYSVHTVFPRTILPTQATNTANESQYISRNLFAATALEFAHSSPVTTGPRDKRPVVVNSYFLALFLFRQSKEAIRPQILEINYRLNNLNRPVKPALSRELTDA